MIQSTTRFSHIKNMYNNTFKMYDNMNKKKVIMKIFNNKKQLQQEYKNLLYVKNLKNNNFQNVLFRTEYAIFSDYINGMDLLEYIIENNTNKCDYIKIMKNISKCVETLHTNNFMHLDIKPENFIICEKTKEVTLIDFYSMQKSNIKKINNKIYGTKVYFPPEKKYRNEITPKNDLWAIGIIGFMLATRTHPYSIQGCNYKNLRSYSYDRLYTNYKSTELSSNLSDYLYINSLLRKNSFL